MPGSLNFRSIASYQYDFIINTGQSSLDYAGASGPLDAFTDWNPAPYWIVNSWITYSNDPFSLTVQGRFIGAGAYRRDRVGPNDPGYDPTLMNSININHVPSRLYVNLAFTYDLDAGDTHGVQLFGSINNLFDKKPPIAPGGNGSMTNPVYFDVAGAAFRMGVRMQY